MTDPLKALLVNTDWHTVELAHDRSGDYIREGEGQITLAELVLRYNWLVAERAAASTRSLAGVPDAGGARETLAALAHEQWSGWMHYMFKRGAFRVDVFDNVSQTVWVMPGYLRERWERQMKTPYADLPEREKESDREEADKVIAVLGAAQRAAPLPDSARAVVEAAIEVVKTIRSLGLEEEASPTAVELIAAVDALTHQARGEGVETG